MSIRTVVASLFVVMAVLVTPATAHATPTASESSSDQSRRLCTYYGESDDIHQTGTDVSVHAWWKVGSGSCGTTQAVVRSNLQIYRLGFWWDVGSVGLKTVYAGGGSTNRVNSRVYCGATTENFTFRVKIDVDLVGVADTPWANYGPEYRLKCYA